MKRRTFLQAAGVGLATARTGWAAGRRAVDVAVVGAGAIGATTAWLLRAEGLSVALLDKGAAGREASWASAGMVQPYGSSKSESWSTRSVLLSRKLYDEFEPRLFEETGRRAGYGGEGGLVLAFDDEEAEGLRRYAGRGDEDHPTRFLDGPELRQRDPGLPEKAVGALLFSGMLPHGTPHNNTGDHRRALQYHYYPDDTEKIATEERLAIFGSEGKDVSC